MAGSNNGRGGGQKKKLSDQYKEACPPHKRKDLDALIKKLGGDETKIMQAIQEWWEEPVTPTEAEWEDVNKKANKKKETPGRGGTGRGPGRGRQGRGGPAGRGGGREAGRRGGGRGGRGGEGRGSKAKSSPEDASRTAVPVTDAAGESSKGTATSPGVPTSVAPVALQGAWGQKAAAAAAPLPPVTVAATPIAPPPIPQPEPPQEVPIVEPVIEPAPTPPAPKPTVRSSGNVWATKGSAHLIKAETTPRSAPPDPPSPSPVVTRPQAPIRVPPPPTPPKQEEPIEVPPATSSVLESGLSASVNGANINAAGWKPAAETTQLDSLGTTMTMVNETPAPVAPKSDPTPTAASKRPPTNVLNMGHWETGDNDETLDFGFGSFGVENETPSVAETTMSSSDAAKDSSTQTAPSASPARPPPGLSIGGATSLPAGAVLVSELESKLEGTSLGPSAPAPAVPEQKADISHVQDTAPPGVPQPHASQILHQGATPGMPQNYNAPAYGMGMYNYNAAGNGFVAGMHGAPVLPAGAAGGIPPKPQGGSASAPPPHLAQGGLYGAPATSDSNINSADATAGNTMPPGMPGMQAYNPALYYGQQPFQMGQPHGVGGYGYAYGAQFGGAVQGGFGYQQGMMGQTGGYPTYDDQQQGNSGGYQKNNSGGYRGRGSSNQYQNHQYNPTGGYGGQPYGMGYNVDHFNQRGGYGHGGMDPYGGMQQQGVGNFQNHAFQNSDDDHHKGKKDGRSNGFQQHPQQLGGQQQQSFGLQGDSNTNSNAGWSNQGGGWGGAPSWQQGS